MRAFQSSGKVFVVERKANRIFFLDEVSGRESKK